MSVFDFGRRRPAYGLGKSRKGKKARSRERALISFETVERGRAKTCKEVTFKRAKKGGAFLPKSKWVTIVRCTGHSAKAAWKRAAKSRHQCRVGGTGPKAHLFTSCKGRTAGRRRRA